ncbi:MAG: hypothetical protein ACHP8A_14450 [Terriglobales bacterium]
MASKLLMMDFEVSGRSAVLTTPAISFEYREFQLCIGFGSELNSRIFRKDPDHADAF